VVRREHPQQQDKREEGREAGPKVVGGESLGGAQSQEGKVRPSPPSGGGESGPFSAGANLWSRDHPPSGGLEERQERRGLERGTAGGEEQDPEGRTPWALRRSTGRRQAWRRGIRREGNQTLRAEGAGGRDPRVNRILRVGTCRRGANPRRVVSWPSGREGAHGIRHSRGRAKRTSGATARESVRGSLARRTPWRSKPRRGGGEPTSRYSRGELEQRSADAQECGGRAVTRGFQDPCARRTLEGRGRFGPAQHRRCWVSGSDRRTETTRG
jgi:hypothetical protein